jgi:hypothetical protein
MIYHNVVSISKDKVLGKVILKDVDAPNSKMLLEVTLS